MTPQLRAPATWDAQRYCYTTEPPSVLRPRHRDMTTQLRAPAGWRIVHWDVRRDAYTIERTRRFFKTKGAYEVITGYELDTLLYADARGWR